MVKGAFRWLPYVLCCLFLRWKWWSDDPELPMVNHGHTGYFMVIYNNHEKSWSTMFWWMATQSFWKSHQHHRWRWSKTMVDHDVNETMKKKLGGFRNIVVWASLVQIALLYRYLKWASLWENRSSGFPTRSDTNRAIQSLKMATCLKFRIEEEEGLYYPCSENKGADQLRSYREADLRLCFRICKKPVFS